MGRRLWPHHVKVTSCRATARITKRGLNSRCDLAQARSSEPITGAPSHTAYEARVARTG